MKIKGAPTAGLTHLLNSLPDFEHPKALLPLQAPFLMAGHGVQICSKIDFYGCPNKFGNHAHSIVKGKTSFFFFSLSPPPLLLSSATTVSIMPSVAVPLMWE
jgi:hypothetical protein